MNPHPIIHIFSHFHPLQKETIEDFESIISYQRLPKNSLLLEIGKRAKSMFFIHKGLARAYYFQDGKDITDYFAIDGQFIGAVPSLIDGLPSKKGIQLIEASEVYSFENADFDDCCARHHDLERAARKITLFGIHEEQQRIESLRFYSVKEKYELMEKKYPGIMNRSPLQYIASYLGTTQVSISRIRAGVQ